MNRGDKVVWLDPAHETSHVTEIVQINKPIYVCSNGTTEIECLKEELVSLMGVTCHSECGCIDIQSEAWSYTNHKKDDKEIHSSFIDAGRNWCSKCEVVFEDSDLINIEDYLKEQESEIEPECSASEEEIEESGVECEFERRGDSWWCSTHNCHV